jgi:uncharacterized protein YbjT (DUF2867 family)
MILVTGATGNVGREVVTGLRAAGQAVRALTRNPERASGLPDDVDVVAGNLDDPSTLGPALAGVTGIFLMSRDSLAGQAAGLLARPGDPPLAHVVLLSSASVEVETPEAVARWRLGARRHRLAEEAVRRSASSWTFLRPGAFASNAALKWAESIRTRGRAEVMFAGETEAPIDPADIAELAVRALCDPGHAGRAYTLTGPEALTPAEQVAIIGDVLGREIVIDLLSPDLQRKRLGGLVLPADLDLALRPGRTPWSSPLPAVAELLGRPPLAFREWMVRNVGLFGSA